MTLSTPVSVLVHKRVHLTFDGSEETTIFRVSGDLAQAAVRRAVGAGDGRLDPAIGGYGRVSPAALAIVPGPDGTITFVRQERGPYAGHWLLPGGRVEFGESLPDTARREALEESGCRLGELRMTGVYEMRGRWSDGSYHVIMFAFLADGPVALPAPRTADLGVSAVTQGIPAAVCPHPTVMRILNDAGVSSFDGAEIERLLAHDAIDMLCL